MKDLILKHSRYIPVATLVIGLIATGWWVIYTPWSSLTISNPGADGFSALEGSASENIIIGAFFDRFSTAEPSGYESWPNFRGEHHDNIYHGNIRLADNFSQGGDGILWSVGLGEGHAGAAIYEGMVYIIDYDEELRADMLRCFSLKTGREIWRRWYNVHIRRNHGMSRTVPAVTEQYILTIGPRGHVMCVERETGDLLWGIDLENEYGTEIPPWYTGQCPLIDNGVAVIATGGSALMIGVDCSTGKVLWETPNNNNWQMSHSSIMPFTFGGKKMYVYSAIGGAAGISAEGPDTGRILWEVAEWNHKVIAASPVCMPDGKIFLTAGYGAGSMVLQLHPTADGIEAEILETFRPGEGLSSEQQTPVYVDGHLFGVLPKDARAQRNQMVCVNPEDFRSYVWTSGPGDRFGLGPFILADGKFYLLDDDGTLFIIEKSLQRFSKLDSRKLVEEGHDAWAPLAIADGYMLLRDSKTMICIDLKR